MTFQGKFCLDKFSGDPDDKSGLSDNLVGKGRSGCTLGIQLKIAKDYGSVTECD